MLAFPFGMARAESGVRIKTAIFAVLFGIVGFPSWTELDVDCQRTGWAVVAAYHNKIESLDFVIFGKKAGDLSGKESW